MAAMKEAYSRPTTPAPTTMISRGRLPMQVNSSVSMMRLPSKGISALRAGRVPQAIRIFSPRSVTFSLSP